MLLRQLTLIALAFLGCSSEDISWYRSGIIYQIFVRSFLDTDQDGIGNIRGITQKIDYLESLGISAILLSPIFPSQNADFGYDVKDFRDVNPEYGTLEDFDKLVKQFKEKGIRVMLDLVPNHSSTEHYWFKQSESRDTSSGDFNDFYVWKDGRSSGQPPNNWLSVKGTGTAWKWSETRRQYYLHTMFENEADLNYANPEVVKRMQEVIQFWASRGVIGVRLDSLSWLYEDQSFSDEPPSIDPPTPYDPNNYQNLRHDYTVDQPEDLDLVRSFRAVLDQSSPHDLGNRVLMVESYSRPDNYYAAENEVGATLAQNAVLYGLGVDSTSRQWESVINEYYSSIGQSWPNWMIGSNGNRRAADRWSPEWVDALNIILLSLKGTAVTYFGEEIGLDGPRVRWDQGKDEQGLLAGQENFDKYSRDFERAPFPWDSSHLAGFSNSSSTWLPLSASYWRLNVKQQETDDRSHLKVYRSMARLRKGKAMAEGDCTVVGTEDGLLYIIRSLENSPTIISVVNIGDRHVVANLRNRYADLPQTVKLLVSSLNFPDYERESLQTEKISLPPKSAIVVST